MQAKKEEAAKKDKVEIPSQTIDLPNASSTQYGPGKNPEPQWFVQWKEGKVDVGKNADETDPKKKNRVEALNSTMEGVSGFLYKDKKRVAKFQGDGGRANKQDQMLELAGHVVVVSQETPIAGSSSKKKPAPTTLTCDRLVYDAKTKIIKALGHVQVVNEVGTIGTLSELWATPELNVVATPNMFKKP